MLIAVASLLGFAVQARYVVPQLPVSPPIDAERYLQRLGASDHQVFADGDLLTLVARGSTCLLLPPDWLNVTMTKTGADGWIGQVRYANAARTFFTFNVLRNGERVSDAFIGKRARSLPKATTELQGSVFNLSLDSKALGEKRDYTVYLPPNRPAHLPAIYLADRECEGFAKAIEPLILQHKMAPVAIVGMASGGYRGPKDKFDFEFDFRSREYLKVYDADRYALHLKFVCDELIPSCERAFGFTRDRRARALGGYSNGGAFALTGAFDRPDMFANAFVLSPGAHDAKAFAESAKRKDIKVWIASGKLESFTGNARTAASALTANGVPNSAQEYESGHDWLMWRCAFASQVVRVFPCSTKRAGSTSDPLFGGR